MLDMIPLCGGAWIDPNGPVAVKIEYFDGEGDVLPVATVIVSSCGLRTRVDFVGATGGRQAEDFANGLARQVNNARKQKRRD